MNQSLQQSMEQLEEINTFQTQLDDVARGVNRIRYLKQKINSSLGTLKAVGNINDDSMVSQKLFSPITARIQSQCGMRKKRIYPVDSQRDNIDPWKQDKQTIKKDHWKKFNNESKNVREKWNDSFMNPAQQKINKLTYRHNNPNKISTFYINSLMKNINSTQRSQISLQELKKINYDSIKRQRQEIKKKINQEKENRNKEVQIKKEKVLIQHRMAKKKTEGFILEKLEDLRTRKKYEKQLKSKILTIQFKQQLKLENRETQRLSKLQHAIFMKQNIKKIIESKLNNISLIPSLIVTDHEEERPPENLSLQKQLNEKHQNVTQVESKDF